MTKYNTSAKTPERVTVIGAPVSAVNMEKALDFVDQAFETLRVAMSVQPMPIPLLCPGKIPHTRRCRTVL